ncbi:MULTISPECIES: hypothetical protein [unclassified Prevotella]|uniref:hypothetical protein n=1 Tax=unclassified Prevotella TaxID=2638335 RepID=UPI00048B2B6A|nr:MULTISPECIES: hypothetical protein [unclassified Prevotella]
MKKRLIACLMLLMGITTASAQESYERGVFNHVGLNVSASTEGIGVGVAAPITDYLELSAGVNFMPGIKIKGDVNVNYNISPDIPVYVPSKDKVKITGNLKRTTMDVKLNIYPFGGNSTFFVAGGFSFGGEKLGKLNGHSDAIQGIIEDYPAFKDVILNGISAELDKYNVKFDDKGDINGDIRVKNFRPYVGLGVGRLVPKHRVGFRFEAGCQFMGKLKVYQDNKEVKINELNDSDDDISKLIDKLTVYPVLKLTITGRIF